MDAMSTLRRAVPLAGAAALATFTLIAWTHRPERPPAPPRDPAAAYTNSAPVATPMNAYGEPAGTPPAAALTPVQPVPAAPPVRLMAVRPHHRYYARPRHVRRRRVVVVRRRPFRRSAEIVGGSAAGGALIGALAGGVKGAGIGALVGGAGGLVYDRLTHKKRVVVRR
jgi:hypothetical protein